MHTPPEHTGHKSHTNSHVTSTPSQVQGVRRGRGEAAAWQPGRAGLRLCCHGGGFGSAAGAGKAAASLEQASAAGSGRPRRAALRRSAAPWGCCPGGLDLNTQAFLQSPAVQQGLVTGRKARSRRAALSSLLSTLSRVRSGSHMPRESLAAETAEEARRGTLGLICSSAVPVTCASAQSPQRRGGSPNRSCRGRPPSKPATAP